MNKQPPAEFPCDLHSHSTCSDGRDTPEELIENAAARKLRVLVLSDHDKIPPAYIRDSDSEVPIREYASKRGLVLIPGMEVSCETSVDDVHIVCVGCDWKAPFFEEIESFTVRSKIKAYKELVCRLREDGYGITWDHVLMRQGKKIEETQVQKKMIFDALSELGFAPTWAEAKAIVNRTARYHIAREKPDALRVIENVHLAGGYAILAHPFLIPEAVCSAGKTLSREEFIETLLQAGLDGIEIRYPYHKTSYTGSLSDEELETIVSERYASRVRMISGGSDYHAEHKTNAALPRQLGECGLTWEEFFGNPYWQRVISDIDSQIDETSL